MNSSGCVSRDSWPMRRPPVCTNWPGTPPVAAPAWRSAVIAAVRPPIWGSDAGKREGFSSSIDHHEGSEEQQPGQEYFDPDLLDPVTGRIDTFPAFRKTIRELSLEETVIPIVSRSAVVARFWTTPLSLIFIDGGHTFEAAFTDYNAWVSHLLPGGYLVIHDIFSDPGQGRPGAPLHLPHGPRLRSLRGVAHDPYAGRSAEGARRPSDRTTQESAGPGSAVDSGSASADGRLRLLCVQCQRHSPPEIRPDVTFLDESPDRPADEPSFDAGRLFDPPAELLLERSVVTSTESSGRGIAPHFSIRSSESRR